MPSETLISIKQFSDHLFSTTETESNNSKIILDEGNLNSMLIDCKKLI